MNSPLVSVIMPAYNAEKFIQESIESVLHQTCTDWELLIVDDGSSDNTKTIAQSFCEKDKRIKYYYQQNGKAGKARNLGLSHAEGKYVAFIDADDIWLLEKLAIQKSQIEKENVDLVFSDVYLFTDKFSCGSPLINSGKGLFKNNDGICAFLELNKIPTSTVFVCKEVLAKVKGFTESHEIPEAEDYHLWLKLLMNGCSFLGSEKVLAAYRIREEKTKNTDTLFIPRVIEVFEDLKLQYPEYKNVLSQYQKKWFARYHYSTNYWRKKDYKTLIKKNCDYVDKRGYEFVFQVLYSLLGFNITRNVINRIINNKLVF